jgi:hypothetical protein
VVIDVAALLELTDQRASIMAPGDQARKGEITFHLAMPFRETVIQHLLHTFPQILSD